MYEPNFRGLCLALLLLIVSTDYLSAQNDRNDEVFFQAVSVFDGEQVLGPTNVLIRDGIIVGLGEDINPPEGAEIIVGEGKMLMPGLIDSHTHAFFESHLIQAVEFGVTTEFDMMSMVDVASSLRRSQAEGKANHRADFFSAGAAVTVAGGHGTQFGFAVPTLERVEDTEQFVLDRIQEGSDYIKIIVEDGSAYGMQLPTLSREKVAAATKAALENDRLAVAHVGSAKEGDMVVELGVSGLVHLFADEEASDEWVSSLKSKSIFVIPTAAVISNATGRNTTSMISDNEYLAASINKLELNELGLTFPQRPGAKGSWEIFKSNILKLHRNGVAILAGTDAPNPGTVHGASMHHELRLLVEVGLSPTDALSAATAAAADAFQLIDRGRIAEGLRADLLLVQGDPTQNIEDIHKILGVWKGGNRIDRSERLERVEREKNANNESQSGETRVIDDFENEIPRALFGAGWAQSTDAMMGGKSTVNFQVVEGGAGASKSSLEISGVAEATQTAFSGIMFSPGSGPMRPEDLSSNKSISFWAKGNTERFTLMLFTQKRGMQPSFQQFQAGEEWTHYSFDFSDFDGSDGSDVVGIWFGTNRPGAYQFQIDEVELH